MPAPKFTAQQVQRVEVIQTPDGQSHRRVFVKLTGDQKKYFKKAREQVETEFPPKKVAARPRVEVVLAEDETKLLSLLDEYANKHKLPNRGAVVRVALSKLLKFNLPIPHHGWRPGRKRKPSKKPTAKR